MEKRTFFFIVCVAITLIVLNISYAGLINYERREKVRTAAGQAKTQGPPLAQWMIELPLVKNDYEKKYDSNRDGKLQTAEVKIFLRDIIDVIDNKGGFTVNSDILKEYDKNKDGLISREEGKLIKEHVR